MSIDLKKTAAFGAAFGIAVVLTVAALYWLLTRAKEWDSSSIKCNRLTVVPTYNDVPANPAVGEEESFEVAGFSIEFVLENTTRNDYTVPTDLKLLAREEPSAALAETQIKFDHPYVIPAKERAEVDAHMEYSCRNVDEAGKITQRPEQECFNDALGQISGFVGFDSSTRTRIDLPKPTFSTGMVSAAKALAK